MPKNLPEPENYNVLHIGPEHVSAIDRGIVREAKRSRIYSIVLFLIIAAVGLGSFFVQASVESSLEKNDAYMSSLIDEVGTLSQQNFLLSQQVESQEAVLQSIESDFSSLQRALESAGGDFSGLQSVFSSILGDITTDLDASVLSKQKVEVASVEDDETLDILILGTNGAHTDTIMVASVNENEDKITLFSIPRDLYINGRRINEYYYYYGIDQLERMVESVTGLAIDKYAQVDLNGFVEGVDILGGIDIYVDKAIYDGLYPNGNGGYSPYSISEGHYHMDGEAALKYARSRKSTSDFDRAARQQNVLEAVRKKVLQLDSAMEMKEISALFQAAFAYLDTDVNLLDGIGYYYDYKEYDVNTGFVLSVDNYLYSMINVSGAYILLPKTGNFDEIQAAISSLVN